MTPNQRLFADEYIRNGRNATRAYMSAYPRVKKEDTARKLGARLMARDEILAYIERELEALHDETIADAREIMQYYTGVMRGEIGELVAFPGEDGRMVERTLPARLTDRNNAAERLAKMLGAASGIDAERLKMDRERLKLGEDAGEDTVVIVDDI